MIKLDGPSPSGARRLLCPLQSLLKAAKIIIDDDERGNQKHATYCGALAHILKVFLPD